MLFRFWFLICWNTGGIWVFFGGNFVVAMITFFLNWKLIFRCYDYIFLHRKLLFAFRFFCRNLFSCRSFRYTQGPALHTDLAKDWRTNLIINSLGYAADLNQSLLNQTYGTGFTLCDVFFRFKHRLHNLLGTTKS